MVIFSVKKKINKAFNISDLINIGKFDQPVLNNASEYEKEKIVGQFDVLYRVLVKLGFDNEDISASFEATFSKSIDDHLDWVNIE